MTPLRQKMIDQMTLSGFASSTQKNYLRAVTALANFYKRSPELLRQKEVQAYLLYLIRERKLSWSTYNIVCSALRYFYGQVLGREAMRLSIPRRKQQAKLPEILSQTELNHLFAQAENLKQRVLLMTAYAAGLRSSEVVHLKLTDIDSQRMLIRINQGKGNKDRYVPLSEKLLEELRRYWKIYHPSDWLFPSGKKMGQPLSVQRLRGIYAELKQQAGIRKSGGFHTLRHCFATHLLEAGVDVRTLQMVMGHRSLQSTTRYVHLTNNLLRSVPSPLDLLEG